MFKLLNSIGNVQIGTIKQIFTGTPEEIIKNNPEKDLYFLGCVANEVKERASDDDIHEKNYIYFDFDIRKKEPKITDEEIKGFAKGLGELLDNSPIFKDWSVIVYTGNGLHVYYTGDFIKVEKDKWRNSMKYLIREISKIVKIEADTACCNVARISRLPLSYNNKGERKLVEIMEQRDMKSDLLKNIYTYSGVIEAENEISGILNAIKQQSKGEKGFDIIEQINEIPIEKEVLRDYPQWRFDGKNFWDSNNQRASSAWINENNVLIKSDSRWILGDAKGFCTYSYRKAQSKFTDKQTFDYFRKEYNIKPRIIKPDEAVDKIEDKRKPFTWGTSCLDEEISPIDREHFNIIAGETGAGKTAFSFDMAIKNAELGHRVLYISLEMSTGSIVTRIARNYAGITKKQWREKSFSETQKSAYYQKKKEIKEVKDLIPVGVGSEQDNSCETLKEIILKHEPDIVFIDNFDLIKRHDNINTTESEAKISKFFTDFSKDHSIPIIMMHHFKKRTGKGARSIDDFRGSGKITHNCTTSIIGYRNSNPETDKEKAEFTIMELKSREFGVYGLATVYFHKGSFHDSYIPSF